MTAQEILQLVDPNREHETDESFTHWYIINGELTNIYNPTESEEPDDINQWYIDTDGDLKNKECGVDLLDGSSTGIWMMSPFGDLYTSSTIDITSRGDPYFWYIDENGDLVHDYFIIMDDTSDDGIWVKGETDEEIYLLSTPSVDIDSVDDDGIWKMGDNDSEFHIDGELDFITYGAFMYNELTEKVIIFPTMKRLHNNPFEGCINLKEIYIHPELEYNDGAFPPETEVKYYPLTFKIKGPTKTTYNIGENLDLTGLVIDVTCNMSVVSKQYTQYTYTADNSKIVYESGFDSSTTGTKTVKCLYCDKYDIIFSVDII